MFYMEFLALMWNLARFQSDTKSGRFILPTGRSGDLSKFRESPGESGRLNMYGSIDYVSLLFYCPLMAAIQQQFCFFFVASLVQYKG